MNDVGHSLDLFRILNSSVRRTMAEGWQTCRMASAALTSALLISVFLSSGCAGTPRVGGYYHLREKAGFSKLRKSNSDQGLKLWDTGEANGLTHLVKGQPSTLIVFEGTNVQVLAIHGSLVQVRIVGDPNLVLMVPASILEKGLIKNSPATVTIPGTI